MSNALSPEIMATVELLGRLDALFWPERGEFSQDRAQVRHGLRDDWRTRGLPVRSRAADTTDRKAEEQLWRRLDRDGLVTVAGPSGRRTHVKLTFAGEMRARVLCATGDVITDWEYFSGLVGVFEASRGKEADGTHGNGNLLSEALVADCTPWQRTREQIETLTRQTIRLLPFLAAGWITASGDAGGRYWLSLTSEGRAAFAAGCPVDPCPGVRLDEQASDLYERTFDAYTHELDSMRPRDGAPVIVRVPVGINWGGHPADV